MESLQTILDGCRGIVPDIESLDDAPVFDSEDIEVLPLEGSCTTVARTREHDPPIA
jgi:hypothetical protein